MLLQHARHHSDIRNQFPQALDAYQNMYLPNTNLLGRAQERGPELGPLLVDDPLVLAEYARLGW